MRRGKSNEQDNEIVEVFEDVRHGQFGRTRSTLTGVGAIITALEIYFEDDLLIADGGVLPTQGSVNPALTIMSIAARAADRFTGRTTRS